MFWAVVVTLVLVLLCIKYASKKPSGIPPGEWGWPFIGFLPPKDRPFQEYVEKFRQKYGDIFSWKMGSRNFVFLCKYNLIKEAFNNPLISDRPDLHSFLAFSYNKQIGIGNSNGKSWQNVRRFTLKFLRDRGMGKSSIEPQIDQEVAHVLDDFKQYTNKAIDVPWSLNVAVLNVTWRLTADIRYDIQNQEMQDFQKLMREIFDGFQGNVVLMDFFPWLIPTMPTFVAKWLGIQDYYDAVKKLQTFIKNVINQYRIQDHSEEHVNFIGAYMEEMNKLKNGKTSEFASTFNDDDLVVALSDLFSAGSETTSSTIRWILIYLAKYQEVQTKLQQEIDSILPRDKRACLDDKAKLPYTNAVICEVMRCMPVTPFLVHHYTSEDTTIGGVSIPKNTIILGSVAHCHKDPAYWEKPLDFYPEHFLLPDGSFDGKKDGFLPFSIGRRLCIGESLAKMMIFLTISALLQMFTFSVPEGETIKLGPDPKQSIISLPKETKLVYNFRK